jgi:hypothetical protein
MVWQCKLAYVGVHCGPDYFTHMYMMWIFLWPDALYFLQLAVKDESSVAGTVLLTDISDKFCQKINCLIDYFVNCVTV